MQTALGLAKKHLNHKLVKNNSLRCLTFNEELFSKIGKLMKKMQEKGRRLSLTNLLSTGGMKAQRVSRWKGEICLEETMNGRLVV